MRAKCLVQENVRSRYQLGSVIGEGGFAKVYVARLYEDNDKLFAIKRMQRSKFKVNDDDPREAQDEAEDMLRYLESEISNVMELDHPNIIKFY